MRRSAIWLGFAQFGIAALNVAANDGRVTFVAGGCIVAGVVVLILARFT